MFLIFRFLWGAENCCVEGPIPATNRKTMRDFAIVPSVEKVWKDDPMPEKKCLLCGCQDHRLIGCYNHKKGKCSCKNK